MLLEITWLLSPGCCLSRPGALYSPALEVPAPIDTLTELRQLGADLTALGDSATAALVRQAIDRFSAWKFEAGEEILARAPEERRKHEHEPPRSPYFNTCALVLAPSG